MIVTSAISSRIWYARKRMWRRTRVLFPSPAELQFVRVMGGRVITFKYIRHIETKFPLAFIVSMGKTLRREYVRREVRVGAMFVDFAFVTQYDCKAIEIDSKRWHRDIVREQERDEYLHARGWRVLHIQAVDIYANPDLVQRRVIDFLSR